MTEVQERMEALIERFKSMPWGNENFYKEWLAQTYYYVCYSTRMLAMAAACSPLSEKDYYKRTVKHISEESNHEMLALKDLQRLGGQIVDYPEAGITRAFYEPQFTKIPRCPKALLGYILALEVLAVSGPKYIFDELNKKYGPEKITFINVHAREDEDHVKEAWKQFEVLSPEDREEVVKNFVQTCDVYEAMLNYCKAKSEQHLIPRKGTRAA